MLSDLCNAGVVYEHCEVLCEMCTHSRAPHLHVCKCIHMYIQMYLLCLRGRVSCEATGSEVGDDLGDRERYGGIRVQRREQRGEEGGRVGTVNGEESCFHLCHHHLTEREELSTQAISVKVEVRLTCWSVELPAAVQQRPQSLPSVASTVAILPHLAGHCHPNGDMALFYDQVVTLCMHTGLSILM